MPSLPPEADQNFSPTNLLFMRIHIGNISSQLAENLDDLKSRLAKYGEIESDLELCKKPMLDTYFLFVDINLDQDQFSALKKGLNGVKFRQSTISIQEAKPKWEWKPQGDDVQDLNPDQLKRLKSHLNKIGVYKGKMREIPRTSNEQPTYRLQYPDGHVHKIRGRMQRLWGYEKKLPQNLVYEYDDGEWKDLTGRPVELAVRNEQDRDTRVAQDVSGGFLSDSDFEEFKQQIDDSKYEGGYEDDEMEVVGKDELQARPQPTAYSDDGDTDEEFYANPKPQVQDEVKEPPTNTTEALRDVLAAPTSFTLFGGDDGEHDDEAEPEPVVAVEPSVTTATRKFGLFFTHSESPFLQTQAQVLKLKRNFDPTEWDKQFWENRGEWNRQLRRRRKEEHRLSRKRGIHTENRMKF